MQANQLLTCIYQVHLEVKKQINQINDEDVESAEKFYIFVTKWVLTHIAKADKVWANFIKEKK